MKAGRMRTLISLVGVVILGGAAMLGTYAYFSQTSTVDNPFDTAGNYGSTIIEPFTPKDGENWMPGVEVDKEVFAKNTGDTDLIVRARLDETWVRKATASADPGVKYKDSKNDPYDVYTVDQKVKDDGKTDADGSVVLKNFSSSTNWVKGADGWYYYKVNLKKGQTTDAWLESVELFDDTDMGKYEIRYFVTIDPNAAEDDPTPGKWVEYTGDMPHYLDASGNPCGENDPGAQPVRQNKSQTKYAQESGKNLIGYGQSDYTLTVTVQTVQPTQEAIDEVFGGGSTFTAPSGITWTLK